MQLAFQLHAPDEGDLPEIVLVSLVRRAHDNRHTTNPLRLGQP
jgi:hypothetical protein